MQDVTVYACVLSVELKLHKPIANHQIGLHKGHQ